MLLKFAMCLPKRYVTTDYSLHCIINIVLNLVCMPSQNMHECEKQMLWTLSVSNTFTEIKRFLPYKMYDDTTRQANIYQP